MLSKVFNFIFKVFLSFFFFLVLTPVGLFLRLMGRDYLSRGFNNREIKTYWINRNPISPIPRKVQ